MKADTSNTINQALGVERAGLFENFEKMTDSLLSNFD